MVGDMQEEFSVPLSQPLSFNLLTAISCFIGKRVLCVSMPPTIVGSIKTKKKKKSESAQGEGEFGCFVIFYVCTVTLGGSSAPLCGSYLLYSHYLILCGGGGGCGEGVLLLFLSTLRCCNLVFYLLNFCMVQLICSVYCWRPSCAAGFVWGCHVKI